MTNTNSIPENRRAPEGMIWECAACGKKAEDLYGMIGARSYGWDESCMLNAAPVPTQVAPSQELKFRLKPQFFVFYADAGREVMRITADGELIIHDPSEAAKVLLAEWQRLTRPAVDLGEDPA